jgi:hypothetical protein
LTLRSSRNVQYCECVFFHNHIFAYPYISIIELQLLSCHLTVQLLSLNIHGNVVFPLMAHWRLLCWCPSSTENISKISRWLVSMNNSFNDCIFLFTAYCILVDIFLTNPVCVRTHVQLNIYRVRMVAQPVFVVEQIQ